MMVAYENIWQDLVHFNHFASVRPDRQDMISKQDLDFIRFHKYSIAYDEIWQDNMMSVIFVIWHEAQIGHQYMISYDRTWKTYDNIWWDLVGYDDLWWGMPRYNEIWQDTTIVIFVIWHQWERHRLSPPQWSDVSIDSRPNCHTCVGPYNYSTQMVQL